MADRDLTISRLELLHSYVRSKKGLTAKGAMMVLEIAAKDAVELLKEQEPVRPNVDRMAEENWLTCGACNEMIDVTDRYCRHCGRRVLWED